MFKNTSSQKESSELQKESLQKPTEKDVTKQQNRFSFVRRLFTRDIRKKLHFPKNFRSITESHLLFVILTFVFIVCTIFIVVTIQGKVRALQVLEAKRNAIQAKIGYWKKVVVKDPGYRDAYFQLALLEYQLGDFQASQNYVDTVESIDPTFEKAYTLEKILER